MQNTFDWSTPNADPHDSLFGQRVRTDLSGGFSGCAAVIFGIPFDGAVLGRRGAAGGPAALRGAARTLKNFAFDGGEKSRGVLDLGDIVFPDQRKKLPPAILVAKDHARTEYTAQTTRELVKRSDCARVVALGGDHSLSYPCALPYLKEFGDALAVINLDAHLDVREAAPREIQNSGTSFGRLIEAGLRSYTVIGARDFQTSPYYVARATKAGAQIVIAADVFESGPARVAVKVIKSLPRRIKAIYLSVDLDVADASVAPGVSAPTPGGLLANQLLEIVRIICADKRTLACDIMELAPNLEEPVSDRTARLGAACLATMA